MGKVSALSSENVNKYQFLTNKDALIEKVLLAKTGAIKIFEYSYVGKELKAQTDIVKNQYQKWDKIYEIDETIYRWN